MVNSIPLTIESVKHLADKLQANNPSLKRREALESIARSLQFKNYSDCQHQLNNKDPWFYAVLDYEKLYSRYPELEDRSSNSFSPKKLRYDSSSSPDFTIVSDGYDSYDDKFLLTLVLRDLEEWQNILDVSLYREQLMQELVNEFQEVCILRINEPSLTNKRSALNKANTLLGFPIEYLIHNYQLFEPKNISQVRLNNISPLLEQFDGSYAKEFLTDCTPEKPVHRNYSWCLHCERTYIEGEHRMKHHPTNGLLSMCPYEDCDGDTVIDNRPWNEIRKFNLHYPLIPERGVEYPELSDKEEPPYR